MTESSALVITTNQRTATSLTLPSNLSVAEWEDVGLTLGRAEHSLMWWIGDWWVFGEHKHGDFKELVERDEWEGPTYQACRDAASVCRKIEMSRRRDNLSFTAHREIAALPPEYYDRVLDWAVNGPDGKPYSKLAIRDEVKRLKAFIALGWTQDQLDRKARAETGECVVANMHAVGDRRKDEALLTWAESMDKFVRVDRKTDWGNPFEMPADGDRDAVVMKFEKFYWPHKDGLQARMPELRGKVLGCWCHPELCHAHIIADAVNKK